MSFDFHMAFNQGAYKRLDMVLRSGDCAVRHYGAKGCQQVEGALAMIKKLCNCITDFGKGFLAGFVLSAIIFGFVVGVMVHRNKVREIVNYVETQQVIEQLREDYANRDPLEFLEDPGIRRAADGAAVDFERRRDEILQRFRSGLAD